MKPSFPLPSPISFASDNHSGVHPNVMEWMARVNHGSASSYGSDPYTNLATNIIKEQFKEKAEVFFVWNGSAANVLSLRSALRPYQAVICSDVSHIHCSECGAPEHQTGSKLLCVPSHNGKINHESVLAQFANLGDVHSVQPKVISITQATEYGTLYSPDEIRSLADLAHRHSAYLHLDGARLSNAAAALNCSLQELTSNLGVDLVSLGGTKNGLMDAEAIIIFDPHLAREFPYIRKQSLHLASKMRFLSAQFLAYFENELWRSNAVHANQSALKLADQLTRIPGFKLSQPVETNAVFAILPKNAIQELQKKFLFYVWNESLNEIRLMCSFNTKDDEIEAFVNATSQALAHCQ